jgi:hypothetical protein
MSSPKPRNPDLTFAELYALTAAGKVLQKQTCEILGISREAWRGYVQGKWRMGAETRERAEKMIAALKFYIEQGTLPALDPKVTVRALEKIRARVEGRA